MKALKLAFAALAVILLSSTYTKAQVFFADKTIRGNSETFKTHTVSKDSFVVVDVTNELYNLTPKLKKYKSSSFRKRPAYVMYPTFTSVFSKDRARELLGETALVVNYYVNGKGEVLEVTFTLRNISAVTAPELERLEYEIISKVNFIIPKKLQKGQNLFIITQAVPYRSLFDRFTAYLD